MSWQDILKVDDLVMELEELSEKHDEVMQDLDATMYQIGKDVASHGGEFAVLGERISTATANEAETYRDELEELWEKVRSEDP